MHQQRVGADAAELFQLGEFRAGLGVHAFGGMYDPRLRRRRIPEGALHCRCAADLQRMRPSVLLLHLGGEIRTREQRVERVVVGDGGHAAFPVPERRNGGPRRNLTWQRQHVLCLLVVNTRIVLSRQRVIAMARQSAFGTWLVGRLVELQISKASLAKSVGVSSTAVQNWSNGTQPQSGYLPLLASALRVSVDDLAVLTGHSTGTRHGAATEPENALDSLKADFDRWVSDGVSLMARLGAAVRAAMAEHRGRVRKTRAVAAAAARAVNAPRAGAAAIARNETVRGADATDRETAKRLRT